MYLTKGFIKITLRSNIKLISNLSPGILNTFFQIKSFLTLKYLKYLNLNNIRYEKKVDYIPVETVNEFVDFVPVESH